MTGCAATRCYHNTRDGYRMFRYPTALDRRSKWILNTDRPNWTPTPSSRLCEFGIKLKVDLKPTFCGGLYSEVHFDDSQYEIFARDHRNRRKLRCDAIPTLFNRPEIPFKEVERKRHIPVPSRTKSTSLSYPQCEHNYAMMATEQTEFINVEAGIMCSTSLGEDSHHTEDVDIFGDPFDSVVNMNSLHIEEEPESSQGETEITGSAVEESSSQLYSSFSVKQEDEHSVNNFWFQDNNGTRDSGSEINSPQSLEKMHELHWNTQVKSVLELRTRENEQIVRLKHEVNTVKLQVTRLRKEIAAVHSRLRKVTFLNKDQRTYLLCGSGGFCMYSPVMMKEAMELRVAVGRKGYNYLLEKGFLLPSASTVNHRLSLIPCGNNTL